MYSVIKNIYINYDHNTAEHNIYIHDKLHEVGKEKCTNRTKSVQNRVAHEYYKRAATRRQSIHKCNLGLICSHWAGDQMNTFIE